MDVEKRASIEQGIRESWQKIRTDMLNAIENTDCKYIDVYGKKFEKSVVEKGIEQLDKQLLTREI
tara:strand:- start:771 stop:965 length:195 start_codon:yes stop_codon:yes gene_type:complete